MNPLQHRFAVWRALPRIKAPNAERFFRPVVIPGEIECPADCVAQLLCFRQISFAATQGLLGPLAFYNVCDTIRDERQGFTRTLSERFLREHAHYAHDPILQNERIAGK